MLSFCAAYYQNWRVRNQLRTIICITQIICLLLITLVMQKAWMFNAILFSWELFSLFCDLSLYKFLKSSSLCLSYSAPSSPCSFSVQSKTLQSKSLLNSYYSGTYNRIYYLFYLLFSIESLIMAMKNWVSGMLKSANLVILFIFHIFFYRWPSVGFYWSVFCAQMGFHLKVSSDTVPSTTLLGKRTVMMHNSLLMRKHIHSIWKWLNRTMADTFQWLFGS